MHGSGALTRWLLENDLVDEMILIVIPVILGQGARLFPETGPDLCARPGGLAGRLEGRNDPGLPAGRAPAISGQLMPVTRTTHRR